MAGAARRAPTGGGILMDALMVTLLGVIPGIAIGAGLALVIARQRGMFNPVVKVTVQIRPHSDTASMSAERRDEYTVIVRPMVYVDWKVLYDAAAGSGAAVIPKEFAPPQH